MKTNHSNLLEEARRAQEALASAGRARHIMEELVSERDLLKQRVGILDETIASLLESLRALSVSDDKVRAKASPARAKRDEQKRDEHGKVIPARVLLRKRLLAMCAKTPMRLPELARAFPDAGKTTLAPLLTAMVKEGAIVRSGKLLQYTYSAPGAVAATSAKPRAARIVTVDGNSVRQRCLDMCLTGDPKTAKQLYPQFPDVPRHTVQSALSNLAQNGLLGRVKSASGKFAYCAPGEASASAKVSPSGAPFDAPYTDDVLAACKAPVSFEGIVKAVPHINRHVVHQTVHALLDARRLRRTGSRRSYAYHAVASQG